MAENYFSLTLLELKDHAAFRFRTDAEMSTMPDFLSAHCSLSLTYTHRLSPSSLSNSSSSSHSLSFSLSLTRTHAHTHTHTSIPLSLSCCLCLLLSLFHPHPLSYFLALLLHTSHILTPLSLSRSQLQRFKLQTCFQTPLTIFNQIFLNLLILSFLLAHFLKLSLLPHACAHTHTHKCTCTHTLSNSQF